MNEESETSLSLLMRLKDTSDDHRGWDEFVRRYQPRIVAWCRRWGLQESDAADVAQNVMLELSKQLKRFEYRADGCFRAWLRTVARRAWYDYSQRNPRREYQAQDSEVWTQLTSDDAEHDLLQTLEQECNRELMEIAMERVRGRVKKTTWEAFQMTEFDGLPAEQVATQLGMKKGTVYVSRGRVQKMILDEVKQMDRVPS